MDLTEARVDELIDTHFRAYDNLIKPAERLAKVERAIATGSYLKLDPPVYSHFDISLGETVARRVSVTGGGTLLFGVEKVSGTMHLVFALPMAADLCLTVETDEYIEPLVFLGNLLPTESVQRNHFTVLRHR